MLDCKIIIVLHDEKSVNKASARLFMSHQTLNNRLDAIEKIFETQLFVKSNKGITFTEAGTRLHEYSSKMLSEYSKMLSFVTEKQNQVSGVLRIGSSIAFAHRKLSKLLTEFHAMYPLVEISLTTGLSDFLIKKLYSEELSVAIIKGDHRWYKESLLLCNEPLYLISKNEIKLEDLPNLPAIAFKTDATLSKQADDWWYKHYKESPKYIIYVDSASMCRQLVIAGLGWGVLPKDRIEDVQDQLFMLPLEDDGKIITRETRMCYKKSSSSQDVSALFVEFMKKLYPQEA